MPTTQLRTVQLGTTGMQITRVGLTSEDMAEIGSAESE
jgi:hypothetical protein